jgi:hypothetical protein
MSLSTTFGPIDGHTAIAGTHVSGGAFNVTINEAKGKMPTWLLSNYFMCKVKDAIAHSPTTAQAHRVIPFPRNESIVDRSGLISDLDRLLPHRPEYQTAALWGLGGSG